MTDDMAMARQGELKLQRLEGCLSDHGVYNQHGELLGFIPHGKLMSYATGAMPTGAVKSGLSENGKSPRGSG